MPVTHPYVSSKLSHREMWLNSGLPTISSWIEGGKLEGPALLGSMWEGYFEELTWCSDLVLYVEPGEVLKGALIELGAALANGKRIYIVWDGPLAGLEEIVGTVVHHPKVTIFKSIEEIRNIKL